jgi:hypothetical protein
MCLRRAPEKYIAGAALDRAGLDSQLIDGGKVVSSTHRQRSSPQKHYLGPSAAGRISKLKILTHLVFECVRL